MGFEYLFYLITLGTVSSFIFLISLVLWANKRGFITLDRLTRIKLENARFIASIFLVVAAVALGFTIALIHVL
jgi:hypothetical protein